GTDMVSGRRSPGVGAALLARGSRDRAAASPSEEGLHRAVVRPAHREHPPARSARLRNGGRRHPETHGGALAAPAARKPLTACFLGQILSQAHRDGERGHRGVARQFGLSSDCQRFFVVVRRNVIAYSIVAQWPLKLLLRLCVNEDGWRWEPSTGYRE